MEIFSPIFPLFLQTMYRFQIVESPQTPRTNSAKIILKILNHLFPCSSIFSNPLTKYVTLTVTLLNELIKLLNLADLLNLTLANPEDQPEFPFFTYHKLWFKILFQYFQGESLKLA